MGALHMLKIIMSILGLLLVTSPSINQESKSNATTESVSVAPKRTQTNRVNVLNTHSQSIDEFIYDENEILPFCSYNNHMIRQKWVSVNNEPFRAQEITVHMDFHLIDPSIDK
jgi:hypothetical protein